MDGRRCKVSAQKKKKKGKKLVFILELSFGFGLYKKSTPAGLKRGSAHQSQPFIIWASLVFQITNDPIFKTNILRENGSFSRIVVVGILKWNSWFVMLFIYFILFFYRTIVRR